MELHVPSNDRDQTETGEHATHIARRLRDGLGKSVRPAFDAETYYAWYRRQDQPRFSEDDRDCLAVVVLGIPWFHRMVMLGYACASSRDRSPPPSGACGRCSVGPVGEKK